MDQAGAPVQTGGVIRLVGLAIVLILAGRAASSVVFEPGRLPAFAAVGAIGGAAAVVVRGRWIAAYLWVVLLCGIASGYWSGYAGDQAVAWGLGDLAQAFVFLLLLRAWPRARDPAVGPRPLLGLFGAGTASAVTGSALAAGSRAAWSAQGPHFAAILGAGTGARILAAVTLTPLVLRGRECWPRTRRQTGELALTVAAVIVLSDVSFAHVVTAPLLFAYLPMAVVFLAVLRLDPAAAPVLPAVLVALEIWYTSRGKGPFANLVTTSLAHDVAAQIYGLVTVVVAWTIALMVTQQRHTLEAVALSERRLQEANRSLRDFNTVLERRVEQRTEELRRRTMEVERAASHSKLAADVSHALALRGMDEISTMSDIAARLAGSIGDLCVICRLSSDGTLVPMAVRAADPSLEDSARDAYRDLRFSLADEGLTASASRSGQVAVAGTTTEMLARQAHPGIAEWITSVRAHCKMVASMHADGSVLGSISLTRVTNPSRYVPEEIDLLQDLADRAGMSFANARLHTELADSEEQFRSALENSPLGATIVSLDPGHLGRFLWVNSAFAELLGYRKEVLLSSTFVDITHPDDAAADQERVRRLTSGGDVHFRHEKRYLTSDGRTIWVRVSISRIGGEVPRYLSQIEDISVEREVAADLNFRAMHDPLTGLANRGLLMDHLRLGLDQLRRGSGSVGVLFLDLDRFKEINDTIGHDSGDEVLREAARRLATCVRAPDTVSRIGGDEFVIVCPGMAEPEDATRVAARILAAFEQPFTIADREIALTTSIGVATTSVASTDPEAIVNRADRALYESKRKGRGRWELYREAMLRSVLRHQSVSADLRSALQDGWMRLYYQPVVDLRDGRIVGAEALLRMDHPEKGMVLPGEFIAIAESSDLMIPLGDWVLAEACEQVSRWDRGPGFRVAVNVSGRQLSNLATTGKVLAAAVASGIHPGCLTLEMTETVLIEGGESLVRELGRLRQAGVGLAIDDFGTGYASLSYLQRFPVDTIKVDRSFINGIGVNHSDSAIVQAVVGLSSTLGLTVIAEGVESQDQAAALRAMGCNLAQGHLFARPQPPEAIAAMLASE